MVHGSLNISDNHFHILVWSYRHQITSACQTCPWAYCTYCLRCCTLFRYCISDHFYKKNMCISMNIQKLHCTKLWTIKILTYTVTQIPPQDPVTRKILHLMTSSRRIWPLLCRHHKMWSKICGFFCHNLSEVSLEIIVVEDNTVSAECD